MTEIGPLLLGVLDAQSREDEALRQPNLAPLARAVTDLAQRIGAELLWPVGGRAERLLGAVELFANGSPECRGWTTPVRGRTVLLIATVGVSDLEVSAAAAEARSAGADALHAAAIDSALAAEGVETFTVLVASAAGRGLASPLVVYGSASLP